MFDNLIAHMETRKKLSPIFTDLVLRGRKLNISHVFIYQSAFSYIFKVPKTIRLNATYYFIMKFLTKENFKN